MHTLLLGIDLEVGPLSRRRRRDSAADLLEILTHSVVERISFAIFDTEAGRAG